MPMESARVTRDAAIRAQEDPLKDPRFEPTFPKDIPEDHPKPHPRSHEEVNRKAAKEAGASLLPPTRVTASMVEAMLKEITSPSQVSLVAEQTSNGVTMLEQHLRGKIAAMRKRLDEAEKDIEGHCDLIRRKVSESVDMTTSVLGTLKVMDETLESIRSTMARKVN